MWLGHNPYYRKWSVKSQEVTPLALALTLALALALTLTLSE